MMTGMNAEIRHARCQLLQELFMRTRVCDFYECLYDLLPESTEIIDRCKKDMLMHAGHITPHHLYCFNEENVYENRDITIGEMLIAASGLYEHKTEYDPDTQNGGDTYMLEADISNDIILDIFEPLMLIERRNAI